MYILSKTPSAEGQYGPIQRFNGPCIPDGYLWWPDVLEQDTFHQYAGFIVPVVKRDTVASYTANVDAYTQWAESQPEPAPAEDAPSWGALAAAIRKGANDV